MDDARPSAVGGGASPPPPLIKPISSSSVSRIAAGQAVTDLASATKELVDNAVDAGAGRVCVTLHGKGLDAIEVSDDGCGVPEASRSLMAAKHATSKLRAFDDLYGGGDADGDGDSDGDGDEPRGFGACAPTLGFRGEALFSLAHLSGSLEVSTRTSSDACGESFSFDRSGAPIEASRRKVPRARGTTVTVRGLFEAVPVRRVDLARRIKGQRTKLIKVLQGYAILCLGTQFTVTDVGKAKGKKRSTSEVRISTSEKSNTLESRIASVHGPKFLDGLARIEIDLSGAVSSETTHDGDRAEASTSETRSGDKTSGVGASRWKLTGLVSHAPGSPHPSTARDVQLFSVNGRPVDLPTVSRVLGDVWRQFDPTAATGGSSSATTSGSATGRKRAACVLALTLPKSAYDVNLNPDKREVMFTGWAAMEPLIREGVSALWAGQTEGTFAANEVESRSNGGKNGRKGGEEKTVVASLASTKACYGDTDSVTPKMRRRSTSPALENGKAVTPPDSEDKLTDQTIDLAPSPEDAASNLCGNKSDCGDVHSSYPDETSVTQGKHANDALKHQHEGLDASAHEIKARQQLQREWDRSNLPDRVRHQDRRGWEQMKFNFTRIEKEQLHDDLDRVMSPRKPNEDDARDRAGHKAAGKLPSMSEPSPQSSKRAIPSAQAGHIGSTTRSSSTQRQSKRQKRTKKNVASFIDSFAFGASKPTLVDEGSESETESDDEELEAVEAPVKRRLGSSERTSHEGNDKNRNCRMVVGEQAKSTEKRPRTSLRTIQSDRMNQSSISSRSDPQNASLEESSDNSGHNPEPSTATDDPSAECVWDSFMGTRDVIDQSQRARLLMKQSRRALKTSLKTKKNVSGEDDATVGLHPGDFHHMSIIGQFNLGFILARCRNHNLWILDQHACDEKYNFERLCKDTVIHAQKLIAPLPLELSPSEEHCVMENLDLFERNGMQFCYDPEKDPRHRLSLTSLPHSGSGGDGKKAVQFEKEDVGALCAMLGADGACSSEGYAAGFGTGVPGSQIAGVNAVRRFAGVTQELNKDGTEGIVGSSIVRLPKAIAMFANRACRVSAVHFLDQLLPAVLHR
ncbi:hypothetical protein ACHAWF_014007 [Thalassiosira exigua]